VSDAHHHDVTLVRASDTEFVVDLFLYASEGVGRVVVRAYGLRCRQQLPPAELARRRLQRLLHCERWVPYDQTAATRAPGALPLPLPLAASAD
jgi:hypothetical protein